MSDQPLTGSRIRERRVMQRLKQADLAKRVGISASYLNLIEHNRRRIGGKLLLNIAAELDVEPQALTEGAEAALLGALREAAVGTGLAEDEVARADEFAGRFPGWAETLAATQRRIADLERTVETLSDRMQHDPHLATSMHELLTNAASVRSTAAILAETQSLEPEWQDRFHQNINEDSNRLAQSAQALVTYLEEGARADAAPRGAAASPQEEVEAFLQEHDFHFPTLEGVQGEEGMDEIIADAESLRSDTARQIARDVLGRIARDGALLPLTRLREILSSGPLDPMRIAQTEGVSLPCVLRRLAAVPELGAGIVVCDRSGTVIFRKTVDGFAVPRFGACCPLWPLFSVLGGPGLMVHETVLQLGRGQMPFEAYAVSQTYGMAGYNRAPMVRATMLVVPAVPGAVVSDALEVGATCRICPKDACPSRRELSILN